MVLSALGVDIEEDKLRELADCTPFGTDAFRLVEAARTLGFASSRKHTFASIDDLARLIDEGLFPIVYVDLWPIRGGLSGQYHSLVAQEVTQESILVLDPLRGERAIPTDDFRTAWEAMHYLTIVIE